MSLVSSSGPGDLYLLMFFRQFLTSGPVNGGTSS